VNALISRADRALEAVEAGLKRGIRCFKIKIGADFAAELAALTRVRARYGSAVALRLDANRAWGAEEAVENLSRIVPLAPEYVEEPAADIVELAALGASPVPLALDESLAGAGRGQIEDWLARGVVAALVLKPMLLGGVTRCLELAALARAHGAAAVVSHLMDGPIALAACGHLALVTGATCGLDPHPGLSAWPDVALPCVRGAYIEAPDRPGLGMDADAIGRLAPAADASFL
jgi:L-alanine-DL-glutamate epimerase-like enolase superfamily enzyme